MRYGLTVTGVRPVGRHLMQRICKQCHRPTKDRRGKCVDCRKVSERFKATEAKNDATRLRKLGMLPRGMVVPSITLELTSS